MRQRALAALTVSACALALVAPACAQTVTIAPFAGYRFGGDFLEALTGVAQDFDGGSAVGAACDIPLHDGLSLEFLYSRQSSQVDAFTPSGVLTRTRASSEYWHAGGLQELTPGTVRPFLTGTLGLTRIAAGGDAEVRFSIGAGGGVKLRANDRVALRLDGRVVVTFMDADFTRVICASGGCASQLHVWTLWQAEFTAGVAFSL